MRHNITVVQTTEEVLRRNEVIQRILDATAASVTIKLPVFDPERERPSDHFALLNVGLEPNDYSGTFGEYRYQFEGEEDLLHLIITRRDQQPLVAEEGQAVASFVLNGVPKALIWLRPGEYSHHFYMGHDELVRHFVR